MNYLENVIKEMDKKTVVFWGAGRRMRSFLQTFCIDKKIIPMPDYICDSTRIIEEKEINGIKVLPFDELKKMDCSEVIIIMTAGLFDLQAQVIQNEFYYFPVYHCRAFEVYYYLKEHKAEYEKVLSMLADEKSKNIYKNIFECFINGTFWNQSLFEGNAYFGNDLIGKLKDDEVFAFAGAFNGKHIDRVLKNNDKVKVAAFEPNLDWFNYLTEKFKNNPNVKIINKILWDKEEKLRFDGDMLNAGLDAHVCKTIEGDDSKTFINSIPMDDIVEGKVQLIALDVEGSECKALEGAKNIIKNDKPKLAICLYHNIEDFITIPMLIDKLSGGTYKFYVKQHSCITAIETVLYAVPK